MRPVTFKGGSLNNIVYIVIDDLPDHMLNAANSPNIVFRLAQKGVRFSASYANTPLCGPMRATTMLGKYTHETGISDNNTWVKLKPYDSNTIATRLQAAGYRTGLFGKFINGYGGEDPSYIPPGWNKWFATHGGYDEPTFGMSNQGIWESYAKADIIPTELFFNNAQGWIDNGSSQPFFAYIAPNSPHGPYDETKSSLADRSHIADGDVYSSPATEQDTAAELADMPNRLSDNAPFTAEERANAQKHFEGKKEELRVVDDFVKRFMDFLDSMGLTNSTTFILVADNGYFLGEYGGMDNKNEAYDVAARVPFIVRHPGAPQNIVNPALVGTIDLAPTFMELAGSSNFSGYSGRSLVPLFSSASVPTGWREIMLLESPEAFWYALRDHTAEPRKYINNGGPNGFQELYFLNSDPHETENKWSNQSATVQTKMKNKLAALKACSGDSCRLAEVP
jgi:N-acetylglucosamine-6-sulfatase